MLLEIMERLGKNRIQTRGAAAGREASSIVFLESLRALPNLNIIQDVVFWWNDRRYHELI